MWTWAHISVLTTSPQRSWAIFEYITNQTELNLSRCNQTQPGSVRPNQTQPDPVSWHQLVVGEEMGLSWYEFSLLSNPYTHLPNTTALPSEKVQFSTLGPGFKAFLSGTWVHSHIFLLDCLSQHKSLPCASFSYLYHFFLSMGAGSVQLCDCFIFFLVCRLVPHEEPRHYSSPQRMLHRRPSEATTIAANSQHLRFHWVLHQNGSQQPNPTVFPTGLKPSLSHF